MNKIFEKIYQTYGLDKKDRSTLSHEEELRFVADCFDAYERVGFTETFHSVYDSMDAYNGKSFSVVGRVPNSVDDPVDGVDLECLPIWCIKFEDGEQIEAYPEEICKVEKQKNFEYRVVTTYSFDSDKPVSKAFATEDDAWQYAVANAQKEKEISLTECEMEIEDVFLDINKDSLEITLTENTISGEQDITFWFILCIES